MSLVYVFGSGECEQLGLGDDQPFEIKKPRRIPLFDDGLSARRILKVVCGGMHTVALSNQGRIYTWGCNDDGALGRVGPENSPVEVRIATEQGLPMTDITAGDSHSIAYNTSLNHIYLWGLYRNSKDGKTYDPVKVPTRIGHDLFMQKTNTFVRKVESGSHHTLVLTTKGQVFAWGDPESGKIGRMLNTRDKNQQALRIEKVNAKNALDIFCGNHHSFYINEKRQVFAWGLNNHGQLGIGTKENTCIPTKITKLEGLNVLYLDGGEHHSIALTADGQVYCWGKNDEGQCGQGDTFGEYRKKQAQEEYEKMMQEEMQKQAAALPENQVEKAIPASNEEMKQPAEDDNMQINTESQSQAQQIQIQSQQEELKQEELKEEEKSSLEDPKIDQQTDDKKERRRGRKKKAQEIIKEIDLPNIFYFPEPTRVETLWGENSKNIKQVFAAGNYCYALEEKAQPEEINLLYSWGFGSSYVLGNRDEENQFEPYQVHPKMFEEMPPMIVGTGTQHVVVLTTDDKTKKELPQFEDEVMNFQLSEEEEEKLLTQMRKRKLEEMEQNEAKEKEKIQSEESSSKSDQKQAKGKQQTSEIKIEKRVTRHQVNLMKEAIKEKRKKSRQQKSVQKKEEKSGKKKKTLGTRKNKSQNQSRSRTKVRKQTPSRTPGQSVKKQKRAATTGRSKTPASKSRGRSRAATLTPKKIKKTLGQRSKSQQTKKKVVKRMKQNNGKPKKVLRKQASTIKKRGRTQSSVKQRSKSAKQGQKKIKKTLGSRSQTKSQQKRKSIK